jgi:hypothetical protein
MANFVSPMVPIPFNFSTGLELKMNKKHQKFTNGTGYRFDGF